jgi:hypothetical protein
MRAAVSASEDGYERKIVLFIGPPGGGCAAPHYFLPATYATAGALP